MKAKTCSGLPLLLPLRHHLNNWSLCHDRRLKTKLKSEAMELQRQLWSPHLDEETDDTFP